MRSTRKPMRPREAIRGPSSAKLLALLLALTSVAVLAFLGPVPAVACSWDYIIWMIHSDSADPLYRFVRKGKAGYIDVTGTIVIKPRFPAYGNGHGEFRNGLMLIGSNDGPYVDRTGSIGLDTGFDVNWEFSNGLAAAVRSDGGKWGYIDVRGEFVIPPTFAGHPAGYVDSFAENLAAITVGNLTGFIDRSGSFVMQPRFLFAAPFSGGFSKVVLDGPCIFVGDSPCPDVRVLSTDLPSFSSPSEQDDDLPSCEYAFVDTEGVVLSESRYDQARDFSDGFAAVSSGQKWGYVDARGELVIQATFEVAHSFSEGVAAVRVDGLYGYVDTVGNFVIAPQFSNASQFSEGLAVVGGESQNTLWYIDRSGGAKFARRFSLASHFSGGLAHVKLEEPLNTYAYIDSSGEIVFSYSP